MPSCNYSVFHIYYIWVRLIFLQVFDRLLMELREVRLSVSARMEPIALSWTMQVPEREAQHEHAT
jgi:hypothetical protein